MLYAFGFDRIGVVLSDLYFVDPTPGPGQEGAERGVRLEVRRVERGELPGSIYSAQPITVAEPIWRADLLETVDGPVGSFDRTHHHPRFSGWEPGRRQYVEAMTADPVGWVAQRLGDLDGLLDEAGVPRDVAGPTDAEELRAAVPEIEATLRRLLADVHAGRRARPPADGDRESVRASWL